MVALLGLCGCGGRAHSRAGAPSRGEPATEQPGAGAPLAAESLARDVAWLASEGFAGRGSYQDGGRRAATAIAARFEALGYQVHRQALPGNAETVIAYRRGTPRALIVAAHYDHLGVDEGGRIYPGADDNASGVAVLLGLAAAFADRRPTVAEPTLLFIAFGAEEDGLVGSRAYVAAPFWPLANTIAVINFDMVGRRLLEGTVDRPAAVAVVGLDEVAGAGAAIERASARAGLAVVAMPPQVIELVGGAHRTDEWSFREAGIPALHFSTGLHGDYHLPSDTADRIDHSQLHRVAVVAEALILALLSEPSAAPTAN